MMVGENPKIGLELSLDDISKMSIEEARATANFLSKVLSTVYTEDDDLYLQQLEEVNAHIELLKKS
jgi:hypothetical protein